MIGGRGGWLGFDVGEETGGGEVAGDDVADMTVDMFEAGTVWGDWVRSRAMSQRQSRPGSSDVSRATALPVSIRETPGGLFQL